MLTLTSTNISKRGIISVIIFKKLQIFAGATIELSRHRLPYAIYSMMTWIILTNLIC